MEELMIKIDNVSKMYKLGQIGGTTIREELQRKMAKIRGKEDPTKKIGAKDYNKGETFMALNGVSFDVKKGERVGIIGHNGAGKSTLLKLLSRVTAPSSGEIGLNGRVASMLEVGTGFHGELTGRENIYMNGAILGMTKKEIDAKMEDIIEFSECRQFIDTPVKRYSSGMYVKLAFSVAAHLDSEIMIMDEVLAVGDMAFQKKCLDKMNDVSKKDGRTILYVSHNMSTIRQLCERVVVLDHGKVVFDGGVEDGIGIYLGTQEKVNSHYEFSEEHHKNINATNKIRINSLDVLENQIYNSDSVIKVVIHYNAFANLRGVLLRGVITTTNGNQVGTMFTNEPLDVEVGNDKELKLSLSLQHICTGRYRLDLICFEYDSLGHEQVIDGVYPAMFFEIENLVDEKNPIIWLPQYWGFIRLADIEILEG